ncbi:MAG: CotH kinase family protein [Oscillospiraceae bacterium]|nr:CotH kinase family protein [Oscillospiraceae bacterium]
MSGKGTDKGKLALGLAVFAAAALLCLFIFFPSILSYDLGAENQKYVHTIPGEELAEVDDGTVYDLPLIYVSADEEDISLLFPDWIWTPDSAYGAMPPREPASVEVYIFNSASGENTLSDLAAQYFGSAVMRLRGRTSSYAQRKRPFKLEIYDENGISFNQPVLSLPAESDFVLIAPYIDRSLIRDWLGLTLGGEILSYSPRCQFVELVIGSSDDSDPVGYQGVYLLTESLKQSVNRINVGARYSFPISSARWFEQGGGYIVKQDHFEAGYEDAHLLMPTPSGEVFMIVCPRVGELTYGEAEAIKAELDFFDDIIVNGSDEELDYYIDIDSFVNMILLNEFLKNSEGMIYSSYYYRAEGGKFSAGPPWDFNIGTGNIGYDEDLSYSAGFYTLELELSQRLLAHPLFKERLKERWQELRAEGGAFSEEHIDELIDSANELLENASLRNDEAYSELFDGVYEVFGNGENLSLGSSLQEREMIRKFLRKRGAWLDENIPGL